MKELHNLLKKLTCSCMRAVRYGVPQYSMRELAPTNAAMPRLAPTY